MRHKAGIGNFFLIAVVFVFAVVLFSSCDRKREFRIKYEVTGTASKADITFWDENGDIEHRTDVRLPYSTEFRVTLKRYDYFYAHLSARNRDSSGEIKCAIYKNGRLVKEEQASGKDAVATVDETFEY
ncbi:MAG: MmpS family protein [Endomicrobium sp.]|jgi:NADH:ubiquinone oxidoreductase subunit 5 (subunit L)/multisubunit Na+/H+ antiporter MnhA subunit|nr:MmpS family protein [Endomicrobium sp.]